MASETEFHFSSVVGFLGSVLLSVNCQGGESNLTDCTILASNTPLENSRQAGVRCMTGLSIYPINIILIEDCSKVACLFTNGTKVLT